MKKTFANPLAAATNGIYGQAQALAILDDGTLESRQYQLSSVGLILHGELSEDEWTQLGKTLRRLDGAIQWLLGDWLNYGERVWGKTYEQVAEETGYAIQTLRDFASVAANVDLSLRDYRLTFNHHRVIVPLEPERQAHYLQLAASEGWSVRRLRDEIDPPTRLKTSAARFLRVSLEARKKYEKYVRKALAEGQGAKSQISQIIDEDIAELQKLRASLWDQNGTG